MEDYLIYQRLISVFEHRNLNEELRNDLILSIQKAIRLGKINSNNFKQLETMSAEEVIDFTNDQLRLF